MGMREWRGTHARSLRVFAGLLMLILAGVLTPASARGVAPGGTETGLPVPRFVSLKAERANVRYGPGVGYDVKWVFQRSGLPVEVIAEFETWRKIRDWTGSEGWVHGALLSARRTAIVAPWSGAQPVALLRRPPPAGGVRAKVQPQVVVDLRSCDGGWCAVTVRGFRGYLPQDKLWGIYPGETLAPPSMF